MVVFVMNLSREQCKTLKTLVDMLDVVRYGDMDPFFHQFVREHVYEMRKLASVTLSNVKHPFDLNEVEAMINVHDLPEFTLKQDFTAWEQAQNPKIGKFKEQQEHCTMLEFKKFYGEWIYDFWRQYEDQKTDMARFVRWLDKYESYIYVIDKLVVHDTKYESVGGENIPITTLLEYNTKRMIDATLRCPMMQEVTLGRLNELRTIFKKQNLIKQWHSFIAELTQLG